MSSAITFGWFLVMLLATLCSNMVLPVRGGATNEAALPLADRRHQVHHARRKVVGLGLEQDSRLGIERCQVLEEDLFARTLARISPPPL